jgi:vacuolar-type H+-ATPase subunit I/STV1
MTTHARLFVAVLSLGLLLFVFNLVRRKTLKENYAILWVLTALVMSAAPFLVDYLDELAHAVGIYYPPALIYTVAIMFIIVLLLNFSVIVSKLSEQNKVLIQEQGILKKRVLELEQQVHNSLNGGGKQYHAKAEPAAAAISDAPVLQD